MNIIKSALLAVALVLASEGALATPVSFDFGQSAVDAYNTLHGTSYTTGVNLGSSYTDATSGVTASAYYYDTSSNTWVSSELWARYEPSTDMGMGVCSSGEESHCILGGAGNGDWNELSQEQNEELIVLQRPAGYSWDQLLVSSLDNNGGTSAGPENGTLYWSGSNDSLSQFMTAVNDPNNTSDYFTFANGDFGSSVNGDVLTTANASGFDKNAQYVAFVSGGPVGSLGGGPTAPSTTTTSSWSYNKCWSSCTTTVSTNNDYSVWQGTLTPMPEPGTLALMGLGLAGLYLGRRRSRA